MTDETLATELIRELKAHSRRWFIIALVELGIILSFIVAVFWYFSLPVDEVDVQSDSGNANYIGRDLEGDLYNGSTSYTEETGSEE